MNTISHFHQISNSFLFRESIKILSSQHKKILSIVLLVLASLAICYAFCQGRFKANKFSKNHEPPFYSPKHLNQEPPMSKPQDMTRSIIKLSPDSALQTTYREVRAPLYEIAINELGSTLPSSNFTIKNYNTNHPKIVEFLIEHQASGDPEIQALWDKSNHKLYLVGGKSDPVAQVDAGEMGITFTCPKHHLAWIRLDLSPLATNRAIDICGRLPQRYAMGNSLATSTLTHDEGDELLLTIP